MNNYLAFLNELYKITNKDGYFKTFKNLIDKHEVNRSISKVLQSNNYVLKIDEGYTWNSDKPNKKIVEVIQELLKEHLYKNKKAIKNLETVLIENSLETEYNEKLKKCESQYKEFKLSYDHQKQCANHLSAECQTLIQKNEDLSAQYHNLIVINANLRERLTKKHNELETNNVVFDQCKIALLREQTKLENLDIAHKTLQSKWYVRMFAKSALK